MEEECDKMNDASHEDFKFESDEEYERAVRRLADESKENADET